MAGLLLLTPSLGFVDLSIINGEVVVQDGVLKTADLQVYQLLDCYTLSSKVIDQLAFKQAL